MPALDRLLPRAEALIAAAKGAGVTIATAESCTGGLVAGLLTSISGSSAVVDRGFVTYSNAAKTEMLGVPPDLLAAHGAVSEPVARAMAEGALARSRASLTVAITGIAGPNSDDTLKPVGLVHFATAHLGAAVVHRRHSFLDEGMAPGDGVRDRVRMASVEIALSMLEAAVAARRG